MQNNNESFDIIFIDTGIDKDHEAFVNSSVKTITLCYDSSEKDVIGHGTAVASVVANNCKNVPLSIIMLKIFDEENEIADQALLDAMKYILHNKISGKVINISCGVDRTARIQEFDEVCEALTKQGRIIVSAFTPVFGMTYPAACKHVIGVDISTVNFRPSEFLFSQNSPVTIRGSAYPVRVAVPGGGYIFETGSSFICAYISSMIVNFIYSNPNTYYNDVCTFLQKKATRVNDFKDIKEFFTDNINLIRNAAVFPFNKEMHSLISFSDLLPFCIHTVYDLKYNRKIGMKTSEIVPQYYCSNDYIINNIENISWDFDTFILGNMSKLSIATKQNLKNKIVCECLEKRINVYSFDSDGIDDNIIRQFEAIGKWCFIPKVTKKHVITNTYGRMHTIALPVLGVFGTSPKQGKFTLQLLLRKWFLNHGYSIGQLGTEPSSLLFGMDGIYNMGLNSTVEICGLEAIQYINSMFANIQKNNKDLLIVGSQSQTVLNGEGNVGFVPYAQYELLMGTQPDAVILCVNYFDDLQYISRTMRYIEASVDCKVIALVLFPYQYDNYQGHLIGNPKPIDKESLYKKCKILQEYLKVYVEILSPNCDTLGELVISYFEK